MEIWEQSLGKVESGEKRELSGDVMPGSQPYACPRCLSLKGGFDYVYRFYSNWGMLNIKMVCYNQQNWGEPCCET